MELNLFFEGIDSIKGYQTRLLKELDQVVEFNKCVCTVKCQDDSEHFDADKYVPIDYEICERNRYAEQYDMNELLPLDREIIKKMLPYETFATQMLCRNMEMDLYFYSEGKHLYLQHLRFWNHIFVKHHINFVFQGCVPHHAHDMIIYGLAKVYGCGHIVYANTSILNYMIPVENLFQPYEILIKTYQKYVEENKEVKLSEYMEHYIQSLSIQKRHLDENILRLGKTKKQDFKSRKKRVNGYFLLKSKLRRKKHIWKMLILDGILKKDNQEIAQKSNLLSIERSYSKRARIARHLMKDLKYYDSLASEPDYNVKYVIYFLHYQPEATTYPLGGVLGEQELIVSLLADALQKCGIQLYVKEHYVQPYRMKSFYDSLQRIPNVKLIYSDADSKELLIKSVAAATCNGTVIQEAIINGKPVLTFGYGPFTTAPGTFSCNTASDIENAIKAISEGYTIPFAHVQQYFQAYQDCATHTILYPAMTDKYGDLSFEESIANNVKCISNKIAEFQERIG